MLNKLGYLILEGIQVIGISAILIVIMHVCFIQPQEVQGLSMYPFLDNGDHLLTEKVTYRFKEPERGDIIVFQFPLDRSKDYIKRIIALPEEKIQVKNNQIIIYNIDNPEGLVLEEKYLSEDTVTEGREFIKEGQIVEVPENSYAVFGDNREKSADSRQWGFITRNDIVGRAVLRWWPPQAFNTLE